MLLPNVYKLGYSVGHVIGSIIMNHSLPDPKDFWNFFISFPSLYKAWWLNLVTNDPIHVLIETTLIASILYMVVWRRKDWREDHKEGTLSPSEYEELLREWQQHGRAGLVPDKGKDYVCKPGIVVHAMYGRTMEITLGDDGAKQTALNFATHDFLGMSDSAAVKEASKKALSMYGCGSCGPRGFYGTIDVHLELEQAMANFVKTDGAILYSDGASTVSSTVAAFAKRGDLLVVDDGVYEPLVTGVSLSRANIKWFRHNDMNDLRRVLQEVAVTDKKLGRKSNDQRRFIVVEGLYKNSGTIVPLNELVALKHEFNYRLILDESFSFGTLGETGRGVMELFNKRHMRDAEIVTISLENALGAVGGVTVGNEEVVDHQRLSGAGYCFSASSPPFTASAATHALHDLQTQPKLISTLTHNAGYMQKKLNVDMEKLFSDMLKTTNDPMSPIIFLQLSGKKTNCDFHEQVRLLDLIVEICLKEGVAFVSTGHHVGGNLQTHPPPAIRLIVSSSHTDSDIDKALATLQGAAIQVLKN